MDSSAFSPRSRSRRRRFALAFTTGISGSGTTPSKRSQRGSPNTFPSANQDFAPIEQFMLGDLTVHMPASLLQRLDRASMAHSLEARVPFLSHRFVDWALTMPSGLKLRGSVGQIRSTAGRQTLASGKNA